MPNQQYMIRRNPLPLGATSDDFKTFDNLITKSNEIQLYAYRDYINQELKRREL